MPRIDTIRECFRHNDWGRDKVLGLAQGLSAEQLDQAFEMGWGSLRQTLCHLYGAQRFWFERWRGSEYTRFPHWRALHSVEDVWAAERVIADARNGLLETLDDQDLQSDVQLPDELGPGHWPAGLMLLHVCNHGVHHRAQALNMLRRLGAPLKGPGLDYCFCRAEQPTVDWDQTTREALRGLGLPVQDGTFPSPRLDVGPLRSYYRYDDWARARVHSVAATLSDDRLDRSFDIGLGTVRKTLLHICDGQRWWYENWTGEPPRQFGKLPETTPIGELVAIFDDVAARRNAFLDRLGDDDLQHVVAAWVRPDLQLGIRIGESILELCAHGTHHRAQVLNMLRCLGAAKPELDFYNWFISTGQTET